MQLSLRRILIGDPLRTEQAGHEKLSNFIALPVFASDALSSVAFATEEMMAALLIAGALTPKFGTSAFGLTPWLSLAIVVLLCVVTVSYRQTIAAYPGGGGAYTVATDNLGHVAGRGAGAALLLDYVLNAAVCASAGAAAIASLLGNYGYDAHDNAVPIALGFLVFIAVVNLRGARESGAIFAFPVYGFVITIAVLIIVGLVKYYLAGGLTPVFSEAQLAQARVEEHGSQGEGHAAALPYFGTFLLLRAFASGCTALTGVEAISNGVSAFKDPAPKNAGITMVWMAVILGLLFTGVSFLAARVGALPPNSQLTDETVLSQVGRAVFGAGPLYLVVQIATCAILIMSANTSFADFPRLGSLMARDGYLPKQLGNIGDKLVFDRGIFLLTVGAGLLVILFKGSVHALIPLFAIGVFLSFTMSQAGMVRRWTKLKSTGWMGKALINGMGMIATGLVTIVFAVVKFADGAWVIVILIPAMMWLFTQIRRHYDSAKRQFSLDRYRPRQGVRHYVVVLVPDIHRGVLPALQYARAISSDARALHISIDPERETHLRHQWTLYGRGMPLEIVSSPYRALAGPILEYIEALFQREPRSMVTIVVPEAIPDSLWSKLLHGQSALLLLYRLRSQKNVIAVNVPYHIDDLLEEDANRNTTLTP